MIKQRHKNLNFKNDLCALLYMSPSSHDFCLMSLYIYSNKMIMAVVLTYEHLVFR